MNSDEEGGGLVEPAGLHLGAGEEIESMQGLRLAGVRLDDGPESCRGYAGAAGKRLSRALFPLWVAPLPLPPSSSPPAAPPPPSPAAFPPTPSSPSRRSAFPPAWPGLFSSSKAHIATWPRRLRRRAARVL